MVWTGCLIELFEIQIAIVVGVQAAERLIILENNINI